MRNHECLQSGHLIDVISMLGQKTIPRLSHTPDVSSRLMSCVSRTQNSSADPSHRPPAPVSTISPGWPHFLFFAREQTATSDVIVDGAILSTCVTCKLIDCTVCQPDKVDVCERFCGTTFILAVAACITGVSYGILFREYLPDHGRAHDYSAMWLYESRSSRIYVLRNM
jgi:hypothetical protein